MSLCVRLKSTEKLDELEDMLRQAGFVVTHPVEMRDLTVALEIILALGSAGLFTTLYQIITKFVENRNKDLEITLCHKDSQITIKGHSFSEEKALLEQFLQDQKDASGNKDEQGE